MADWQGSLLMARFTAAIFSGDLNFVIKTDEDTSLKELLHNEAHVQLRIF